MKRQPRRHFHEEGRLCEAGQHAACPSVGDPYDDREPESTTVWVCSCWCHRFMAAEPTPRKETR